MNIISDIERLPNSPGVYLIKDSNGTVIYIGKAKNIKDRVKQHFSDTSLEIKKERTIQQQAYSIEFLETRTETEAILLERRLIKDMKPKLNVRSRDDKSSLLIRISKEEIFPQLYVVRETDPRVKGSLYFGPYGYDKKLRETVKVVLKLFPIANCGEKLYKYREKKAVNRCMRKKIGQCIACDETVTPEEYSQVVEHVIDFLDGNVGKLLESLESEMWEEVEKEKFERAAVLRDLIKSVKTIVSIQKGNSFDVNDMDVLSVREEEGVLAFCRIEVRNKRINYLITDTLTSEEGHFNLSDLLSKTKSNPQEIKTLLVDEQLSKKFHNDTEIDLIFPSTKLLSEVYAIAEKNAFNELARYFKIRSYEKNINQVLADLQVILKLERKPVIIHGYDISTLGGKFSTGSCVVFENGEPAKKYYKRFRIKKEFTDPNDYAMMKEILKRHYVNYERFNEPEPDLILLDGGKGQLNIAIKVLKELKLNYPLVSIAKKHEELFVPGETSSIKLPKDSEVLKLLQRIRDEAHRFAIRYSQHLRNSSLTKSTFESIKGVGKKKATILHSHFSDLHEIAKASSTEIKNLLRVDEETASKIIKLATDLENTDSFE